MAVHPGYCRSLFLAWCVLVALVDNMLKPLLIGRGSTVPMAVILAGVLGGLLAHGLIGLFVGPIVLALGYELFRAWLAGPSREVVARRKTEAGSSSRLERCLDPVAQRAQHLHPRPPLVLGLDQRPRRVPRARAVDHVVHGRRVIVPLLQVASSSDVILKRLNSTCSRS